MIALLVVLTFVVLLLGVLVAGLLRSHADILRSLHELGVGVGDPTQPSTAPVPVEMSAGPAGMTWVPAPAVAGLTPSGDARAVSVDNSDRLTLLGFLSSGCPSCAGFWEALQQPDHLGLPDQTRVVIVTKGPELEITRRCRPLTSGQIPVLMSTEAWHDYQVPGSPFFVLVDGTTGQKIGQGVAAQIDQLVDLVRRAQSERGPAAIVPRPIPAWTGRRVKWPTTMRCVRRAFSRVTPASIRVRSKTSSPTRSRAAFSHRTDGRHRGARHRRGIAERLRRPHLRTGRAPGRDVPVAQFATFPLPDDVGDFGGGAVNLMGPGDVYATLFEYGPESLGKRLFARQGRPTDLWRRDFSPMTLRRGLGGQSGTQRFFTESDRPFSFYAVLGSHVLRNTLVPKVNALLASLGPQPTDVRRPSPLRPRCGTDRALPDRPALLVVSGVAQGHSSRRHSTRPGPGASRPSPSGCSGARADRRRL